MSKAVRTEQHEIAEFYAAAYQIDAADVLFLNDGDPYEPWFAKNALLAICRQSAQVKEVAEWFDKHSASLNQVFHQARLIRNDNQSWELSGVATIGERIPNSAEGELTDAHKLAAARALHAVMDAAGVNPLRPGAVVETVGALTNDDPRRRINDLARIHILAREAGLIDGRDKARYREWLKSEFKVSTAVKLGQADRASAVERLSVLARRVNRAKRR